MGWGAPPEELPRVGAVGPLRRATCRRWLRLAVRPRRRRLVPFFFFFLSGHSTQARWSQPAVGNAASGLGCSLCFSFFICQAVFVKVCQRSFLLPMWRIPGTAVGDRAGYGPLVCGVMTRKLIIMKQYCRKMGKKTPKPKKAAHLIFPPEK